MQFCMWPSAEYAPMRASQFQKYTLQMQRKKSPDIAETDVEKVAEKKVE